MDKVCKNLEQVRDQIDRAERRFGRTPGAVRLIAVSKRHSTAAIRQAIACGQSRFGESYAQEARDKMPLLAANPLEWHFIGPLQSNKTRLVAEYFSWVHSVDRLRVAQRLSEQRPEQLGALNVCLQVNTSGEVSKGGVPTDKVAQLARATGALPGIVVRGLMTLPAPSTDFERQREPFRILRELRDDLARQGFAFDTLSMGMTRDLEAAIAEGSTMVRVGTGIFGPRSVPPESD